RPRRGDLRRERLHRARRSQPHARRPAPDLAAPPLTTADERGAMIEPSEYCRQIETYHCRKNEGHLVRIVGPVFEQVSGWAAQGVPLAVAFKGIDQYCERYYAKGPRGRRVRVEFCEGDVLDLFDDWRRAVGVSSTAEGEGAVAERKH